MLDCEDVRRCKCSFEAFVGALADPAGAGLRCRSRLRKATYHATSGDRVRVITKEGKRGGLCVM